MSIVVNRRIITTQDAIRGLKKIHGDVQTKFHDQWDWMNAAFYVEALRTVIERLPRWVPTSESLPDDPDRSYVQIFIDGVVQRMPARYDFAHEEWVWADDNYDAPPNEVVTHWRYLPEVV